MGTLLLVGILILLGVGWIWEVISNAAEQFSSYQENHKKMISAGLRVKDLGRLLSEVPTGYIPDRRLYRSAQRARKAQAGATDYAKTASVVDLHEALAAFASAQAKERVQADIRRRAEIAEAERRRVHIAEMGRLAAEAGPPSLQDLLIRDDDYRRDNETDRQFRRKYMLRLLGLYQNACALCGSHDNGVDLDHFFLPKSSGGSFVLRRRDGVLIGNAVPMCERCNRSKGSRPWRTIGEPERLSVILRINAVVNQMINSGE